VKGTASKLVSKRQSESKTMLTFKRRCRRRLRRCFKNDLGSISPNFFHQAKSCQLTVFGKKIDIQFHQQLELQISSLN